MLMWTPFGALVSSAAGRQNSGKLRKTLSIARRERRPQRVSRRSIIASPTARDSVGSDYAAGLPRQSTYATIPPSVFVLQPER